MKTKNILFNIVLIAVSIVIIESALQIMSRYSSRLSELTTDSYGFLSDLHFKRSFLNAYDRNLTKTESGIFSLIQLDSELGYTIKPNLRYYKEDKDEHYTTNSLGARSKHEYHPDKNKYKILFVGDSFTFGDYVDDSEIYPTILQSLDKNIQVFNFAVSGYGIDQMYIMLKKRIDEIKPNMVIVAFISDDMYRSTLKFRTFIKPYFIVKNNKLVQMNVSITKDYGQVASEIREELSRKAFLISLFRLKTVAIVHKTYFRLFQDFYGTELNNIILKEMVALSNSHGAEFVLLYLPWNVELQGRDVVLSSEKFFNKFVKENHILSHNPRKLLLRKIHIEKEVDYREGHYKGPVARIVAESLHNVIVGAESYKSFQRNIATPVNAPAPVSARAIK